MTGRFLCPYSHSTVFNEFNYAIKTATQIWEIGEAKTNTMDFAEAIDNSDLEAFGFTDDFIFELWGAITDAKAGRLRKQSKEMSF